MSVPCRIGDYTDFYTSISHATTVGRLFRPDAPLLPNYSWVPIGYHGRSSTIGVSGQRVPAPRSGKRSGEGDVPAFGPSQAARLRARTRRLHRATAMPIGTADRHGQRPRRRSSGSRSSTTGRPATSRPGSTSRSARSWRRTSRRRCRPWIVPIEAFEPFRTDLAFGRPIMRSRCLTSTAAYNRQQGAIDIKLEVWLQTSKPCATRASRPSS